MNDARTKIATVVCISAGVLAPTSALYVALAAAGLALWTIAGKIPPMAIVRRVWKTRWFLVAIVAVNALTLPGTVIAEAAGMYITSEGLLAGAAQSARLMVVLWAASMIMLTTPLDEMMDVVEQWSAKRGRPLVAVGVVTLNYLPLLVESARRVHAARRSRGSDDGRGIVAGVRAAAASALPLFAVALRNADALAEAMDSRGYSPSSARTPFRELRMAPREAGIPLFTLACTVASLAHLI